jgi:hypothetical protein
MLDAGWYGMTRAFVCGGRPHERLVVLPCGEVLAGRAVDLVSCGCFPGKRNLQSELGDDEVGGLTSFSSHSQTEHPPDKPQVF